MYRKQRLIHTLLLIAVGAGALAASLLLRPEVPSFLPWVCFAVLPAGDPPRLLFV